MNKILTSVLICILFTSVVNVSAQVRSVSYDFQKNTFDNDYNLPSEERFTMTGFIDSTVQLVELEIYEGKNKKGEKKGYYATNWQKDKSDSGNQFYLSVKQPLRQNSKYDFELRFFRSLNSEEVDYTKTSIVSSIYNYLAAIAITEGKSIQLSSSTDVIQEDMNRIVQEGLSKYRTRTQDEFPGFSDIVLRQLEEMSDIKGKRAREIKKDENNSVDEAYTNKIAGIVQQVDIEVEQFFNNELLVLSETKTVKDHPTEKQRNIVAINGGYGGAWFNGNLNDFNYGHAPYVGLSFPLGKKAFTSKFWSNTSISTGVFVLNFKDKDGSAIKGPIIQRPFYVALGYKFFRFLRFNAGAVLLEKEVEGDRKSVV